MTNQSSILIVDDNDSLCKSLALILKLKGHAVTVALDGLQAIEHVQEKHFDLIFLDVKMIPIDGVETFVEIQRIRPGITVMMMTAYAVEDRVEEALRLGARGVLYKPVDIEEVIALAARIS